MDGDWRTRSLCTDVPVEVFFPGRAARPPVEIIDRCLHECPVREQCLAYALNAGITFGWWGGLSPRQRRTSRQTSHPVAA